MSATNISDYGGFYLVQIYRKAEGHIRRRFAVSDYGGRRRALQAAKNCRDKLIARLPPARRVGPVLSAQRFLRVNNTSGVAGVSLKFVDGEPVAWVSTWRQGEKGARKQRHKYFYIGERYDYDGAFRAAVKHRQRMEVEHYSKIRVRKSGRSAS